TFSYRDTGVSTAQLYEYQIGARYLLTGINCPPTENRGRVILLVDKTLSKALSPELDQLEQDLVGDGWKVVRHDVPR
ncbi:hypothetical protein, partial [Salmonella sp. SAL4447]|uniref:hypothetical protein n=1 Tax=Salmonella sp. SAL4447 TaxID=3159902 RepID=UPI00397E078F